MNPDLSQLRDIHLPPPISWWPPAPGWWLLLGVAALLLAGAFWWFQHRRNNRWRRQALQELTALRGLPSGPQAGLIALSVLLRRVAISRFPRHEVAALNGDACLAFLDRTLGTGNEFASDTGRLLSTAPYVQDAQIYPQAALTLFDLSERWIRKLPRRGAK
jgi:hypothetical protein